MAKVKVLAPFDGKIVALENVPDEVFAQKMVGDGLAIEPTGNIVVAPITGRITKLFHTGHAFVISSDIGVELLVHIGLDTVELNGQGFEKLVKEKDFVQVGTPLVGFNRTLIERLGKLILSPIVSVGIGTIVEQASENVRAGRDHLFVIEV